MIQFIHQRLTEWKQKTSIHITHLPESITHIKLNRNDVTNQLIIKSISKTKGAPSAPSSIIIKKYFFENRITKDNIYTGFYLTKFEFVNINIYC
mgnify:CR=1 FL=1